MQSNKLVTLCVDAMEIASLTKLLDNIQTTVGEPSQICVVVRVATMAEINPIAELQPRYSYAIRPTTNRDFLSVSNSYFYQSLLELDRYWSRCWDLELKRYIGLFPDHIFALKISRPIYRSSSLRAAPETFGFFTRQWLVVSQDVDDFWSSDLRMEQIERCLREGFQVRRTIPLEGIVLMNEAAMLNALQRDRLQTSYLMAVDDLDQSANQKRLLLAAQRLHHATHATSSPSAESLSSATPRRALIPRAWRWRAYVMSRKTFHFFERCQRFAKRHIQTLIQIPIGGSR